MKTFNAILKAYLNPEETASLIRSGGRKLGVYVIEGTENGMLKTGAGFLFDKHLMVRLNLGTAKILMSNAHMTLKKTPDGEFKVIHKGDTNPDHGYFTTDLIDAILTGYQMAKDGSVIKI